MPEVETGSEHSPPKELKKASLGGVAKTVLFAFFGVRKRAEHEQEAVHLSPVKIIMAGLIGAAVLITILALLARFIVARALG